MSNRFYIKLMTYEDVTISVLALRLVNYGFEWERDQVTFEGLYGYGDSLEELWTAYSTADSITDALNRLDILFESGSKVCIYLNKGQSYTFQLCKSGQSEFYVWMNADRPFINRLLTDYNRLAGDIVFPLLQGGTLVSSFCLNEELW